MSICLSRPCWQAVLLFLPLLASTQNYFIDPPGGGPIHYYADDAILSIGSTYHIQWNTTFESVNLWLYQNNNPHAVILQNLHASSQGAYEWLVEITSFGFSLEDTNIFFFIIMQDKPPLTQFASHYVNITAPPPTPSSRASTSSYHSSTFSSDSGPASSRTLTPGTRTSQKDGQTTSHAKSQTITQTTTQTTTRATARDTTVTTGLSQASGTSNASSATGTISSSPHSTADIGIGVGVGAGIAALLVTAAVVIWLYRKRSEQRATISHDPQWAPGFRLSNPIYAHLKSELPGHGRLERVELDPREHYPRPSELDPMKSPVELSSTQWI